MKGLAAFAFLVMVASCQAASPEMNMRVGGVSVSDLPAMPSPNLLQAGEIVRIDSRFGVYFQYIPNSVTPTSDLIVIVHGTPGGNKSALNSASVHIRRWVRLAEEKGAVLVAPAFDQRNFASKEGGYGGYRGLYGREVDADEFVHLIVDSFDDILSPFDGRFYLYGHSAGGQFANRYVVRHPDRIKAAVISAAGRYAYPNSAVEWHYGMGPIRRRIEWADTGTETNINIRPDPDGWIAAAQLPITVVVGDQDTEPQPQRPGQIGRTRIETAQSWVDEMNSFAALRRGPFGA